MERLDRVRRLDPDWRAVLIGALAAPVLTVVGSVGGWLSGGLLPGDCQGLACVYLHVLLLYSAALLGVWALVATLTALARQRWPWSRARLVLLRVLAGLSYLPAAWVVTTLADLG